MGEAVREVIIRAICNYSTLTNITINSTSVELNPAATDIIAENSITTNTTGLNSCEKCFLSTPLSEVIIVSFVCDLHVVLSDIF